MPVDYNPADYDLQTPAQPFMAFAAPGGAVEFVDIEIPGLVGESSSYPVPMRFPDAAQHYWMPGRLILRPESYVVTQFVGVLSLFSAPPLASRYDFPQTIGPIRTVTRPESGEPVKDIKPSKPVYLAMGYDAWLVKVVALSEYAGFGVGVRLVVNIRPSIRAGLDEVNKEDFDIKRAYLSVTCDIVGQIISVEAPMITSNPSRFYGVASSEQWFERGKCVLSTGEASTPDMTIPLWGRRNSFGVEVIDAFIKIEAMRWLFPGEWTGP